MSEQIAPPEMDQHPVWYRWFQVGIVLASYADSGPITKTVLSFVVNEIGSDIEAAGAAVAHALKKYPPSVLEVVSARDITDVMSMAPDPQDDEDRQTLWACAVAYILPGGGAPRLHLTTVRAYSRVLARGMASAEAMLCAQRRAGQPNASAIRVTGVAAINADAVAEVGHDDADDDVGDREVAAYDPIGPIIPLKPLHPPSRLLMKFNVLAIILALVLTAFGQLGLWGWIVLPCASLVALYQLSKVSLLSRRLRRLLRVA